MKNLYTGPMTRTDAEEIADWTYEKPYDLYNLNGSPEAVDELLQEQYWTVHANDEGLVGFYCTGEAAQVPAGREFGAYDGTSVHREPLDFGVGMRPNLTGMGFGSVFFQHVLKDLSKRTNLLNLRLTVAAFNERAIRLYQKFGFRYVMDFDQGDIRFQTMTVPVTDPGWRSHPW